MAICTPHTAAHTLFSGFSCVTNHESDKSSGCFTSIQFCTNAQLDQLGGLEKLIKTCTFHTSHFSLLLLLFISIFFPFLTDFTSTSEKKVSGNFQLACPDALTTRSQGPRGLCVIRVWSVQIWQNENTGIHWPKIERQFNKADVKDVLRVQQTLGSILEFHWYASHASKCGSHEKGGNKNK